MAKQKQIPNEAALLKEAIRIGMLYAEKRGVVEFEPTDSGHNKIEFIYRLLVLDKVIQPLALVHFRYIIPEVFHFPWGVSRYKVNEFLV